MRFLLWKYVKDSVLLPPVSHEQPELRKVIIPAILENDRDMLQRVWVEMDYRLAV
jgi:hypothetical protein